MMTEWKTNQWILNVHLVRYPCHTEIRTCRYSSKIMLISIILIYNQGVLFYDFTTRIDLQNYSRPLRIPSTINLNLLAAVHICYLNPFSFH